MDYLADTVAEEIQLIKSEEDVYNNLLTDYQTADKLSELRKENDSIF